MIKDTNSETSLEELEISSRIISALESAGIDNIEKLVSDIDNNGLDSLLNISGIGESSLEEIETSLTMEPVKTESDIADKETREVVYVGIADKASRIGAVTGTKYEFEKDDYGEPIPTTVYEEDYPMLIAEKGRGCARRDPEALFLSKFQWEYELEEARSSNR